MSQETFLGTRLPQTPRQGPNMNGSLWKFLAVGLLGTLVGFAGSDDDVSKIETRLLILESTVNEMARKLDLLVAVPIERR